MKKNICVLLIVVFLPLVIAFTVPVNTNDADDLVSSGYKAYNQGDWQTALVSYRKAINIPGYSTEENWFMLIVSEVFAGDSLAAVHDAERFFTLFPHSSYASYVRYHTGRAYFMLTNYVNTVYHLTEFCHDYPNHELYAAALFWIAESFFARENYDAAKALYERIVTGYPRDPKKAEAQARLETIRWIQKTNAQMELLKKNNAEYLAAKEEYDRLSKLSSQQEVDELQSKIREMQDGIPSSVNIPSGLSVPKNKGLTEQQQFIATLVEINAALDKDKQKIIERRKMLADILARNSTQSALQWSPGQQRLIADMVTRNPAKLAAPAPADSQEKMVTDLLSQSAELNARAYRPEERQKLIADVQAADNSLYEEQKKIEGQQRLIAELITSSMGLSESGPLVAAGSPQTSQEAASIDRNLSLLESQFSGVRNTDDEAVASEYANLLRKARLLWAYIVDQNQY
ncbi:MAG: tetratricopeptide repeat protein [Treponema sp.]|jgi:outer membrane protein assembly factor BamD (BamD/ComL family)|nr:tetratricopeptide repeat protein [Treponema sp.]